MTGTGMTRKHVRDGRRLPSDRSDRGMIKSYEP